MPVGNRRMMNPDVTRSGNFLMMPPSTQALYFQLLQGTDDDGVAEAYAVMRLLGSKEDEIAILVAKKFITVLDPDQQVIWINHWHEHNYLRADRLVPSVYRELLVRVVPNVKVIKSTKEQDNQRRLEEYHRSRSTPRRSVADPRPRVGKDRSVQISPIRENTTNTKSDAELLEAEIDISGIEF